jgi:hypothetical protein
MSSPEHVAQELGLQLEVQVVDFLSGYTVAGILAGFTPGEVTLLLREPLSEQRDVSVHANGFEFQGRILYCRPKHSSYEAHITIDDTEETGLRRSPRFPLKLAARLFSPTAGPVDSTIVDISRDGMGIDVPVSLAKGQAIAIATGSVLIFAVVRHCRQLPEGLFRAGVEMHHLLEKASQVPAARPGFLGMLMGIPLFQRGAPTKDGKNI